MSRLVFMTKIPDFNNKLTAILFLKMSRFGKVKGVSKSCSLMTLFFDKEVSNRCFANTLPNYA
jgi:hypothetical protein